MRASHFSDATDQVAGGSSANNFAGIAISGDAATATEGKWQWSSDGATWHDIAGVSDLYPTAVAALETGGIVGRVTKNGQGVRGAHVVAFNPESGELIGNFTLNANGDFVIARLPPGSYVLRAEPIDDADPDSFFPTPVDANFQVTYAQRMVVAPKGGSSAPIEIRVTPK